jgi:predicted chitinase
MFVLTPDHVRAMVKNNGTYLEWHAAMIKRFDEFNINTPEQIAGIVSLSNFNYLEEDLDYSKRELMGIGTLVMSIDEPSEQKQHGPGAVGAFTNSFRTRPEFKGKFGEVDDVTFLPNGDLFDYWHGSRAYDHNPEKIANRIYAGEHGNGDESSGDGWKFRSRGCIRILGRTQYTAFGADKRINRTPDEAAEYIESRVGSLSAACWLWNDRMAYAAADDIYEINKLMGGKLNPDGTIPEKINRRYDEIKALLNGHPKAIADALEDVSTVLSQGDRGRMVYRLNDALSKTFENFNIMLPSRNDINTGGVNEKYGVTTTQLVKEFQKAKGLKVDGIAGNITLSALDIF